MKLIKQHHKKIEKTVVGAFFAFLLFLTVISALYALPTSPTINMISNSTSAAAGVGMNLSAGEDLGGGFIHTITLNGNQQDYRWKAYVGNVTGKFVLEDSAGYSIYEWPMDLNVEGEVYISRNQTVLWSSVNCSNRSTILAEDIDLVINSAQIDSINRTFNSSKHTTFKVGDNTIQNSTCPSIATYVNATEGLQTNGEANVFQEVLLQDSAANLIYSVIMQDNWLGYNNMSYDFQAIVADDESTVTTGYYFYLELGA